MYACTFKDMTFFRAPALALASTLIGFLSGCMYYDKVWQPSYPGAKEQGIHGNGRGGAKSIEIGLGNGVTVFVPPLFINKNAELSINVYVPSGTMLRMVSNQARLEADGSIVAVPLKYKGALDDISSGSNQSFFQLKGKRGGYDFDLSLIALKGNEFYLEFPVLTDPDHTLNWLRVRFERRRRFVYEGF
jgi:hypothetical protein